MDENGVCWVARSSKGKGKMLRLMALRAKANLKGDQVKGDQGKGDQAQGDQAKGTKGKGSPSKEGKSGPSPTLSDRIYYCDKGCGFSGLYEVVLEHERTCVFVKVAEGSDNTSNS